jgi:ADP-ribose pyrophosphatase YjhB (NUDIX family)
MARSLIWIGVSIEPGILARGPWPVEAVRAVWREDAYVAAPETDAAADAQIAALEERGSPSHDGLAARMASFDATDGLELELQPMRWSLRLVPGNALASMSVLCVVRDADGRWLAGRRAAWVSSWANRWALGAGGAVEVGENPAEALTRELEEEWSLVPERTQLEALVCTRDRLVLLIGQAWVPADAPVVRDDEHDAHAWWPADPDDWPEEAEGSLRFMAKMLQ